MNVLLWALGATLAVSFISFVGVLTFSLSDKFLQKIIFLLVGFSAGALMGGAFLHLIPEAVEEFSGASIFVYVLVGFFVFFIIERFLHWHHCHKKGGECNVHTFAYMNLFGDGVHNFIDGLVIAGSFAVDISLGIATTLAVIFHEIPQEVSDFGVLIYGGFSKLKALFYNFLSATLAIFGAIAGVFLSAYSDNFTMFLLPFTAGGFIYIASSDLVPELHKEPQLKKSMLAFICFLLGVVFMYLLKESHS